jgi:hypothetical protein
VGELKPSDCSEGRTARDLPRERAGWRLARRGAFPRSRADVAAAGRGGGTPLVGRIALFPFCRTRGVGSRLEREGSQSGHGLFSFFFLATVTCGCPCFVATLPTVPGHPDEGGDVACRPEGRRVQPQPRGLCTAADVNHAQSSSGVLCGVSTITYVYPHRVFYTGFNTCTCIWVQSHTYAWIHCRVFYIRRIPTHIRGCLGTKFFCSFGCSILKYCSIIYIMVFGKLGKISVFKTEVLQIL